MRVLLTCFLFFSLSVSGFAQKTKEFHLDEEYSFPKGGTIHLESNDADVIITGSDRNTVHLKVDYLLQVRGMTFGDQDDFRMEVEETSDGLKIHETNGSTTVNGFIGSMKEDYKILIEVPRDVSLHLDGDDDDYTITGIRGDIDLDAEDGDINLRDVDTNICNIFISDGDINMKKVQGKLRIRGEDGDIRIVDGNFSAIDLEVEDGDVVVETAFLDEGKYQFEAEDGDIELTFLSGGGEIWFKHDDGSLIANGAFEIIEHNEHDKRLRLAGGNAQIRVRLEDGDLSLNAPKY